MLLISLRSISSAWQPSATPTYSSHFWFFICCICWLLSFSFSAHLFRFLFLFLFAVLRSFCVHLNTFSCSTVHRCTYKTAFSPVFLHREGHYLITIKKKIYKKKSEERLSGRIALCRSVLLRHRNAWFLGCRCRFFGFFSALPLASLIGYAQIIP